MATHTPHVCGGPVFGRLSPDVCARCAELSNGAPKRQWRNKRREYEQRVLNQIARHDFAACAVKHGACTCFDW